MSFANKSSVRDINNGRIKTSFRGDEMMEIY